MKSFVFILLHAVFLMMEASDIDHEIKATNIFHFGESNSTKVAQPRIIGGDAAAKGKYPFFAQWAGCGASLIHGDILLTAAHCVTLSTNAVIIGPHIYGYADGVFAQSRQVVQRVSHPSNNPSTIAFDFMVLKLNYPIADVDPVKLNSDPSVPGNYEDEYTAIGFGATAEDGQPSNTLQAVSVKYIAHDLCNSKEMYDGKIQASNMICAAGIGRDSCQGDSGGPLVKENVDGSFTQVGIVSWGYGCARTNFPGVYSRISGASDWIQQQICRLSNDPPASCQSDVATSSGYISGPGDGEIPIVVAINFDDFPTETGWKVLGVDGHVHANYPAGTSTTIGLVLFNLNLDPGDYAFIITDLYSDGICCAFGEGRFDIYAKLSSGDLKLAGSNGNFGAGKTSNFSISAKADVHTLKPTSRPTAQPTTLPPGLRPTHQPAKSPTVFSSTLRPSTASFHPATPTSQTPGPEAVKCKDSTRFFNVDSQVGRKDCSWLSNKLDHYGYLCRFPEVSVICRSLCDGCKFE